MLYDRDYDFSEESVTDYIKVEYEEYQKEQENLQYYETAIDLIENTDDIEEIKEIIKELRKELK